MRGLARLTSQQFQVADPNRLQAHFCISNKQKPGPFSKTACCRCTHLACNVNAKVDILISVDCRRSDFQPCELAAGGKPQHAAKLF